MDKQMVSIIVPVYNAENYLRDSIDSIINQTYSDLEILLVDDGSKDDSGKICDRYAEIDNRIKVFHRPNSGVSKTRNYGLDHCTGEWVAFVDSDDYIEKDYIEHYLKQNANSFNVGGYNLFGGTIDGIDRHYSDKEYKIDLKTQSCLLDVTPEKVEINVVYHICGKIYSREILQKYMIRFHEEMKLAEDCCFNIDYLTHCKEVIIIPYAGYYYRKSHVAPVYKMDLSQFKKHVDILNICIDKYFVQYHYHFNKLQMALVSSFITSLKDGIVRDATFLKLLKESRCNKQEQILNDKLLVETPGYLGNSIKFIYDYPVVGWIIVLIQRIKVKIREKIKIR